MWLIPKFLTDNQYTKGRGKYISHYYKEIEWHFFLFFIVNIFSDVLVLSKWVFLKAEELLITIK
jgi:hypothetical protein